MCCRLTTTLGRLLTRSKPLRESSLGSSTQPDQSSRFTFNHPISAERNDLRSLLHSRESANPDSVPKKSNVVLHPSRNSRYVQTDCLLNKSQTSSVLPKPFETIDSALLSRLHGVLRVETPDFLPHGLVTRYLEPRERETVFEWLMQRLIPPLSFIPSGDV